VSSNPTARDHNKASVLDVVLARAPLTRNELIELTGLSKATVSRAVEDLRSDGFITDGGVDAVTGRGRKSTYLDVPGATGHVVGFSFGAQTSCVLVTDLRGREVKHLVVPTLPEDEVDRAAAWIADLIAQCSESAEGPLRQVVTAVPGRVQDGAEIFAPAESRAIFAGPDLHRAMEDLVEAPVLLDSDANASLLGVLTDDAIVRDAALFILSTRVTFASCAGREIAKGRSPAFGNLGALFSAAVGETLDGLLSTTGLLRFARRRGLDLERVEALWLEDLDKASRDEVLEAFTTAIATAVSTVAVTLDPESVYFVGRLRPLVDEVLPEVRRRLDQSLPAVPEVRVVTQVMGLSVAKGAAAEALALAQDRLRGSVLEARRHRDGSPQAAPAF
jgi:predicted NBD/HSP70 family sugar kinase